LIPRRWRWQTRATRPTTVGRDVAAHAEAADADNDKTLDPRVTAMLPAELIQPGEIVILLLKPSPWYILLEPLRALAIMVMMVALAVLIQDKTTWLGDSRRDLILTGVLVIGVRLFWQFLEWMSRVYVLTDRRVIRVQGVLRISVFETPLSKIQHTHTYFSLRERFFALGTLGFATAGTGIVEAYWRMIAKPLEVHRVVVQTIGRYK
jgi:hypothetical protein